MKVTGAAATGALGSLAGCAGGNGETPTEEPANGGGGGGGGGGGTAGMEDTPTPQETRTVDFMSATAAESAEVTQFFNDGLKRFQDEHPSIEVALEKVSFGDVQQKLNSSVGGGNRVGAVAQ